MKISGAFRKKAPPFVAYELKPEGKTEHCIDGKSAIKTCAGTDLIDTGMAVTSKGTAVYVTNPVCEKGSSKRLSAEKINKPALSPGKAALKVELENGGHELSRI